MSTTGYTEIVLDSEELGLIIDVLTIPLPDENKLIPEEVSLLVQDGSDQTDLVVSYKLSNIFDSHVSLSFLLKIKQLFDGDDVYVETQTGQSYTLYQELIILNIKNIILNIKNIPKHKV